MLRGNPKRVEAADMILYFAYFYKYTDDDEYPKDKLKQYLRDILSLRVRLTASRIQGM